MEALPSKRHPRLEHVARNFFSMAENKFVGEPVAADDACNWYSETQGDGLIMQFRVTSTLHRCQTKFQQVRLLRTHGV
jgi:hypothetical protein